MGVVLQLSGIEAPNSIIKGERYHYHLRIIPEVTTSEYNKLADNIVLRLSMEAINDSMEPNGLLPSLLVFRKIPKFPSTSSMNSIRTERFEAFKVERAKIETIAVAAGMQRAAQSKQQSSSIYQILPRELERVYRERTARWEG